MSNAAKSVEADTSVDATRPVRSDGSLRITRSWNFCRHRVRRCHNGIVDGAVVARDLPDPYVHLVAARNF